MNTKSYIFNEKQDNPAEPVRKPGNRIQPASEKI